MAGEELHFGDGGNHEVLQVMFGDDGNHEVLEWWVGTPGGNQLLWTSEVPIDAPDWASGYPQADPASDDGALLQLVAVSGAAEYDVYYRVGASMGGDPEGTGTLVSGAAIASANIVGTPYLHATGEALGTEVYYQARGRNPSGAGPFGTEASVVLTEAVPSLPPDWWSGYPKDNPADDDGALLRLVAVGDATAYDIYYRVGASMGGDPEGTGTLVSGAALTPAQVTSAEYLHSTGQAHGTVIYYQPRARNAGGPGPWGTEQTVTIAKRIPGDPYNLNVSVNYGTLVATISWLQGAPDNETSYVLQERSRACGAGTWGGWATVGNGANDTDADRGVLEEFEYQWQVKATNEAGDNASGFIQTSVEAIHQMPLAPDFTAGYPDKNASDPEHSIDLSWTIPSGTVSAYDIRYRLSGDSWPGSPQVTDITGGTTYTVSGLLDDATWEFQVRGTNDCGDVGDWSNTGSATTDLAPPDTAPSWFTGYPKDNVSDDDGILLRLIAAGGNGTITYDVYYRIGSSMGGDPLVNGTLLAGGSLTAAQIVSTEYLHSTGQAHGTVIYYQARGKNAAGSGPWSSEASVTVTFRIPGVPVMGTPSQVSGTATVPWTQPSPDNETLYRVEEEYRTTPGGAFGDTVTFTNPANDLDADRLIADGREYRWRTRAEGAAGNSAYADWSAGLVYAITPGLPTSVSLDYDGTNPDSELIVSWAVPSSGTIDGYEIEVVPYASSFTGVATHTATGGATTSKRITGLSDDTRYKAQVRAVNDWGGAGSWAGPADEWTAPSAPGAVTWTSTYPKATAKDTLAFSVQAATDADEYRFYGDGGQLIQQAGQTYNWTGLSANSQHSMYVVAVNKASVGSPHADVAGTASSTQYRYTLREAPSITSVVDNTSLCPTQMQKDVTVSHLNGDSVARSESFKVEIYNGSTWTLHSTQSAGTTAFTIPASAGDTQVRVYYTSESSSTAASAGLGIVTCPT